MIVLLVDSGQTLWRGAVRQGTPLCLQPGIPDTLGAWPLPHTRPPAVRPAGVSVSYTQHLLREVCADSPAPRHRLFLAAVTVHYSHENRNSSPYLLPWDTAPGTRTARDPGLGPLVMHCLWSWVMAKATRSTGTPPPVVLREAQSLDQRGLEGCEVGTGGWDQVDFA